MNPYNNILLLQHPAVTQIVDRGSSLGGYTVNDINCLWVEFSSVLFLMEITDCFLNNTHIK